MSEGTFREFIYLFMFFIFFYEMIAKKFKYGQTFLQKRF